MLINVPMGECTDVPVRCASAAADADVLIKQPDAASAEADTANSKLRLFPFSA